jgi:hypothetical protein
MGTTIGDHLLDLRIACPAFSQLDWGGAKGTRTPDPLLAKQVLFQLSYSPELQRSKGTWTGTLALAGFGSVGPATALDHHFRPQRELVLRGEQVVELGQRLIPGVLVHTRVDLHRRGELRVAQDHLSVSGRNVQLLQQRGRGVPQVVHGDHTDLVIFADPAE